MVLIANLQYAAIGKERFLAVLHLLGDPIDSLLSLLCKVETWRQYQGAHPSATIISAATTNLVETLHPHLDSTSIQPILRDLLHPTNHHSLSATATQLTDLHINQSLRTTSSIALYLLQVTAAFVPKLGQAATPSGGRIATATLFSWLIPTTLLSNSIGDFVSRRAFLRIMRALVDQQRQRGAQPEPPSQQTQLLHALLRRLDDVQYFRALAFTGGMYTYRPQKFRFLSGGIAAGTDPPPPRK